MVPQTKGKVQMICVICKKINNDTKNALESDWLSSIIMLYQNCNNCKIDKIFRVYKINMRRYKYK